MRSFSCAAVSLVMACSCASVYANGTILLTRPVNGVSNDTLAPVGSGLFSINDYGGHLQQLTPFVAGSYYMPSWVAIPSWAASQYYSIGAGYWLTKNFSPDGQSVLYFQNPSLDPADGQYSGKYFVKNLRTGTTHPLFAGSNDNAAPGYGYLARDPADGNTIAFTNSTSEYAVASPCVYLMHADGSDQHILWCAPPTVALPDYPAVPLIAVESLRWSGNGKKLLAYASYVPPPLGNVVKLGAPVRYQMPHFMQPQTATGPVEGGTGWSALYLIDVETGTAVEVGANMVDPPSGDISYDGTKVIYQQYDYAQCGDEDQEALGDSLCFKDMNTGNVTDLFPPTIWSDWGSGRAGTGQWWTHDWYPVILLSSDGSQAAFTMQTSSGNEADLYTINTDGTNLHQLTTSSSPSSYTAWTPVAWSPDNTQILVNRTTVPASGSSDQTWPSEIHIVTVSNGDDRLVTSGYAVDWLEKP